VQQLDIGESWRQIAIACVKRALSNEEGSRILTGKSFWKRRTNIAANKGKPVQAEKKLKKDQKTAMRITSSF
jgi:hypothetical protein